MERPFEPDDIEDVRIIVRAKGKHYSIVPETSVCDKQEAKDMRISVLSLVMACHNFVDTALEDLKELDK